MKYKIGSMWRIKKCTKDNIGTLFTHKRVTEYIRGDNKSKWTYSDEKIHLESDDIVVLLDNENLYGEYEDGYFITITGKIVGLSEYGIKLLLEPVE